MVTGVFYNFPSVYFMEFDKSLNFDLPRYNSAASLRYSTNGVLCLSHITLTYQPKTQWSFVRRNHIRGESWFTPIPHPPHHSASFLFEIRANQWNAWPREADVTHVTSFDYRLSIVRWWLYRLRKLRNGRTIVQGTAVLCCIIGESLVTKPNQNT
jgi:hypothetical protein